MTARKKATRQRKSKTPKAKSSSPKAKTGTSKPKTGASKPKTGTISNAMRDVPSLFRLNIEVGNLDRAAQFYGTLLAVVGRKQAGSRCYFQCGTVTLQVVDVSHAGAPHPAAKALYFTVNDLDAIFERAEALGCLSNEEIHGVSGGGISVRPWGERSFYAEDPWSNPLCFVEAGTIYTG